MTQEEKNLLMKDLCMRLFTETKIKIGEYSDYILVGINVSDDAPIKVKLVENGTPYIIEAYPENARPYLRSMDSMTHEENIKHLTTCKYGNINFPTYESFIYLASIHIDFNDLISKGLAVKAAEDMY